MSAQLQSSPRIVVGVDDHPASRTALDWAADVAAQRHLPLHLVHAAFRPLHGPAAAPNPDHSTAETEAVLAAATARVREVWPGVEVTTSTAHGNPAVLIVDSSRGATMVVVGARSRGALRSAMLGSTSVDVAAHSHAPVVVVRQLPQQLPQRAGVVVGTDGSALSAAAIAAAFQEADQRSLPLTVVHAWFLDYVEGGAGYGGIVPGHADVRRQIADAEVAVAAEAIAGWSEKYPDVGVRQHVVNAHPVQALVDHSRGAELVVVGSRGRGGFTGLLLGSVSQGVLHHAQCPVMVVRNGSGVL